MDNLKFIRMSGAGNSFIIFNRLNHAHPEMINKGEALSQYAISPTDGIIYLMPSNNAAFKMLYFSFDRTKRGDLVPSNLCGNGVICAARLAFDLGIIGAAFLIETGDGIKQGYMKGENVVINMGKPRDFKKISENEAYLYIGNAQYVQFSNVLDKNYVEKEGTRLRYSADTLKMLGNPKGVLQFNQVVIDNSHKNYIRILTREGGVEGLTLACGTGSVASAYVSHKLRGLSYPIVVHNQGGDIIVSTNEKNQLLMEGSANYSWQNHEKPEGILAEY